MDRVSDFSVAEFHFQSDRSEHERSPTVLSAMTYSLFTATRDIFAAKRPCTTSSSPARFRAVFRVSVSKREQRGCRLSVAVSARRRRSLGHRFAFSFPQTRLHDFGRSITKEPRHRRCRQQPFWLSPDRGFTFHRSCDYSSIGGGSGRPLSFGYGRAKVVRL